MDSPLLRPFRDLRSARTPTRRRPLRTARCVLVDGDRHLLVVHAGKGRRRRPVWGLPGGHIDPGEAPDVAARRELEEELYLAVPELHFVDDYAYKGSWHRVYTAPWNAPITRFDDSELLEIGWFTVEEVQELADAHVLHAGYEAEVVRLLATPPEKLRAAG
jgi:ADP-ribose pyrophosphatase YjhB (NUDIX family)